MKLYLLIVKWDATLTLTVHIQNIKIRKTNQRKFDKIMEISITVIKDKKVLQIILNITL